MFYWYNSCWGGAAVAAINPDKIEYPKVCNLVLPVQAHGKPNRGELGTLHVYRDADGDMVSLEIVTDSSNAKSRNTKARKDNKNEIIKLCQQGYEFGLIGDLPKGITSADQTKSAFLGEDAFEAFNFSALGFQETDRAKVAWGLNVMPSNFSITRTSGTYYGNIVGVGTYYNTNGFYATGVRPSWASTQWLTFNMTPDGLATSGDHIPIILFFTSSYQSGLIGNGFIIGENTFYPTNTSIGTGPCLSPTLNTQIEAFWSAGNAVYANTCALFSVSNNVVSSYALHANRFQDVMYQRTTSGQTYTGTKNTAAQQPHFTLGGFNPNEGGTLIAGAGFGSGNYTVTFNSVNTGWF